MRATTNDSSLIPPDAVAIIDLLGNAAIRKAAARVPQSVWDMDYSALEERLAPSALARKLKTVLWETLYLSAAHGTRSKLRWICARAGCSYDYGYELFTTSPHFLAWAVQIQKQLDSEGHHLLSDLCEKIAQIVRAPVFDERGRVLSKNVKAVLRSTELLWRIAGR